MSSTDKSFAEALADLQKVFKKAADQWKVDEENFWNSLTEEQQLHAFCAVVRRLVRGELVEQGTYRHVLYHTFEFGQEAYVIAQCAGFLELHNAIKVE